MPKNLVEGQDADDVASYVGAVAGIGDIESSSAPPATRRRSSGRPRASGREEAAARRRAG